MCEYHFSAPAQTAHQPNRPNRITPYLLRNKVLFPLLGAGVVKSRGYVYRRPAPINRMARSRGRVAPFVDPGPVVTLRQLHPATPRTHPCSYRILGPRLAAADIDSPVGSTTRAASSFRCAMSKYFLNNVLIVQLYCEIAHFDQ